MGVFSMCFKALCMRGVGRHFLIKKKNPQLRFALETLGFASNQVLKSLPESWGARAKETLSLRYTLESWGGNGNELVPWDLLCSFVSRKTPVPFDRGQSSPPPFPPFSPK